MGVSPAAWWDGPRTENAKEVLHKGRLLFYNVRMIHGLGKSFPRLSRSTLTIALLALHASAVPYDAGGAKGPQLTPTPTPTQTRTSTFTRGPTRTPSPTLTQTSIPISLVAHFVVYHPPTDSFRFRLEFNRPPDFFTVDARGRQRHSFQFLINSPADVYPRRFETVVRGGEIYQSVDELRVRDAEGDDPDPISDGWGPIVDEVSYSVDYKTLSFEVSRETLAPNIDIGFIVYHLEIREFSQLIVGLSGNSLSGFPTPTPTSIYSPTPRPPPNCFQTDTLRVLAAGPVSIDAATMRLRLTSLVPAAPCGFNCILNSLAECEIPCAQAAILGITEPSELSAFIAGAIVSRFESSAPPSVLFTLDPIDPALIHITGSVPFGFCLCLQQDDFNCTPETRRSLECEPSYNLGDGIDGNETSDIGGFVSGIGLEQTTGICVPTPTFTPTLTPLPSTTPTNTFLGGCVQAAEIRIPCKGALDASSSDLGLLITVHSEPPQLIRAVIDISAEFAEGPVDCSDAATFIAAEFAHAINTGGIGEVSAEVRTGETPGILVLSQHGFRVGLCTLEAGLNCAQRSWDLTALPLFNLLDGVPNNESNTAHASGIGFVVNAELCPGAPLPTPTSMPTPTPPCDSGAYLLLKSGAILKAGQPWDVVGGFVFDPQFAINLERAVSNETEFADFDLAVLDGSGMVSFVEHPEENVDQDFVFPLSETFPIGRAVDLVMTRSSDGFWVLTDFGGIFRAGDAKDPSDSPLVPGSDRTGVLGYDVPFGSMRSSGFPNPGGASLRATALVVIDVEAPLGRADGYIVIDSMGGRIALNEDGTPVVIGQYSESDSNNAHRLLEPGPTGYVWPYFPGLDIVRDVELFETQEGVVVYDGWGGIHPVPVNQPDNAVFFTRNEDSENPGNLITTVGMPYVVAGFDNPDSPEDESDPRQFGADAFSVFVDFDFSAGCLDAFYTLDRLGGIYAFGPARTSPSDLSAHFDTPFIPNQKAVDIEFFAGHESGFETDFETNFSR